jgi:hypothetical protein
VLGIDTESWILAGSLLPPVLLIAATVVAPRQHDVARRRGTDAARSAGDGRIEVSYPGK